MEYDLGEERRARAAVDALVEQFAAGHLTEEDFIKRLVALPVVEQAALPDAEWFDAIIVRTGP